MQPARFIGTLVLAVAICAALTAPLPAAADYANPAVPGKQYPAYWLDLGGLYSTYGNFHAAVRAYEHALKLDPASSDGLFGLGLAYMGMEKYDQALQSIDKALQLDPGEGLYLYGRARVLLMSGLKEKSLADFKAAAAAGVPEAIGYLAR